MLMAVGLLGWACGPAAAAVRIEGQVQAGGGASCGIHGDPMGGERGCALAAGPNRDRGRRSIRHFHRTRCPGGDILYLIATGGVPAVNKADGEQPGDRLAGGAGG